MQHPLPLLWGGEEAVKNILETMEKEGFFVCDTAGVYRIKGRDGKDR